MRILFVHPNYRSGGAEIAGTWPPAWVAYLSGPLRHAGFDDITFIDAMTEGLSDEELADRMRDLQPDLVGTTAITPSIYAAERVLEVAALIVPRAVRVLGGIHATFMYAQVLAEAPHIDVIVRGEGEEIAVELFTAIKDDRWPQEARAIKGLAFREGDKVVATEAADTIKDMGSIKPDWDILDWSQYTYIPLGTRVAIPKLAVWLLRRLPATLAAPLLMAAIRKHAWTFVGAGLFVPQGAWQFTIDRSNTDDPVPVPKSLLHWYAAVFTRLYRELVASDCICRMLTPEQGFLLVRSFHIGRG